VWQHFWGLNPKTIWGGLEVTEKHAMTGDEAGLSGNDQIRIALEAIVARRGIAQMADLYGAVEEHMKGIPLSEQGKAS
jgi:hypothetical protein